MSRWVLRMLALVWGLALGCASAPEQPRHLVLTRELVQEVAPSGTRYQHSPTVVRWGTDKEPAECRADCSGLMNEVFKRTWSLSDADLAEWLGSSRPLARSYFRAINRQRGFERIESPGSARPGDVIAIKYESGAGNSGHVAIIDDYPVTEAGLIPTGLLSANLQGQPLWVWRIKVIDASSTGHGPGDTRYEGSRRVRNGLGVGVLRLAADESGRVVAHSFSTSATGAWHPVTERPVVIGRVTGPPARTPEPSPPANDEAAREPALVD